MRRQATHPSPIGTAAAPVNWQQHWPGWVIYAAVVWSLLYGVVGLYWALGGAGFPFGRENDRAAALSILANVQAATATPVIAGLGLLGVVVAWLMARNWGDGRWRWLLLSFAWLLAVTLALLFASGQVETVSFAVGLYAGMTLIQTYFHQFSKPLPPAAAPPPVVSPIKLMSYAIQANPEKPWKELLVMTVLFVWVLYQLATEAFGLL